MTTDEYDQLLADIRLARLRHAQARSREESTALRLDELLDLLDQEEHRLAQQALNHTPIASRKLVVGE